MGLFCCRNSAAQRIFHHLLLRGGQGNGIVPAGLFKVLLLVFPGKVLSMLIHALDLVVQHLFIRLFAGFRVFFRKFVNTPAFLRQLQHFAIALHRLSGGLSGRLGRRF